MTVIPFPKHVRRGSIVVVDGDEFGLALRFPLNPETYETEKSARIVDHQVFGRNYPVAQFVGGGVRTIDVSFPVDALVESTFRNNVGVFAPRPGEGAATKEVSKMRGLPGHLRILKVVSFLEALVYSRAFRGGGFPGTSIPRFLFLWGDNVAIRCIMRSVRVRWLDWDDRLNPIRAVVVCRMSEEPDRSFTFEDRFDAGDALTDARGFS